MSLYKNGVVKSITTPLDGSPSFVTIEVDNPADPPDPPRINKTFEVSHEKTIDRLIDLIGGTTQVDVTTDANGAITNVKYHA